MRKLTVSELIRESKPDWEHVKTREKRSSTSAYNGILPIVIGEESIGDQVASQLEGQNDTFWDETEMLVMDEDDSDGSSGLPG